METYKSNKKEYLELKNDIFTNANMTGGRTLSKLSNKFKSIKVISYVNKNDKTSHEDTEIFNKISDIAKNDIKNINSISLNDLRGLVLRVYERDGKAISPIIFRTPKIIKYLDEIDKKDQKCENNTCVVNTNSFKYNDYYDEHYGDITKNNMKNMMLDFNTKETNIKVAFYDNYMKGNKGYFEINLPIKLVDFIEKLFDHFDKVNLGGYPDNGGLDMIKYNKKDDIYLVYTWS